MVDEVDFDAIPEETKDTIAPQTGMPTSNSPTQEDFSDDEINSQYVKIPKVGDSSEWLTIKDLKKDKFVDRKDKDGIKFSVALPNTEYTAAMTTDKGRMDINNWEVFGKIKGGLTIIAREKGIKFYDLVRAGTEQIRIKHLHNGFRSEDPEDILAKKEKRLYMVVFKRGDKIFEYNHKKEFVEIQVKQDANQS